MAQRGKIYRHFENRFRSWTEEEKLNYTLGSANIIDEAMSSRGMDFTNVAAIVWMCAQIGTNKRAGSTLSSAERKFAKDFFSTFIENCDMENTYEILQTPVDEKFYSALPVLIAEYPEAALHFFLVILSFALVDDVVEDDLAQKLETIFAIPLMVHFSQSGLESVPDVEEPVQISLTDLEARIVEFYQKNNSMQCVDDIASALPSYNKSSLVRALNSLCKKGVLKKVPMALGDLYSPVSTVDLSSLHVGSGRSASSKKKTPSKSKNTEHSGANRIAKLRKEYENQKEVYDKDCEQVEETRKIELKKALDVEKQNLQKKASDALEDAKQKYNQCRKECEERIAAAEKVLASAGFFQFSEKAEAKRECKAASGEIIAAEERYSLKKAEYRQAMQELDNKVEENRAALTKAIERKYPLPTAPEKPDELKNLEEAENCERIRNRFGSEFDYYAQRVLCVMDFEPTSVSELKNRCIDDRLRNLSWYRFSDILRVLEHDGIVKSTGSKYFLI